MRLEIVLYENDFTYYPKYILNYGDLIEKLSSSTFINPTWDFFKCEISFESQ